MATLLLLSLSVECCVGVKGENGVSMLTVSGYDHAIHFPTEFSHIFLPSSIYILFSFALL